VRARAGGGRQGTERGIALLLAVWLLALLAVIVGEFVFSSRVKAAADRNARDALQAHALALAGYQAALAALDGGVTHLSRDDGGGLLLHRKEREDALPAHADDVPLGEGTYSWSLEDEDGKIGINDAGRTVLTALLGKVGLEFGAARDTILDSILDWRDANREHRLNGAEEDYYRSLDPPYSCRDGPFDTVEELLLVRGLGQEHFLGHKEGERTFPGIRELVTVYPVDFNPNTAPQAVLEILGRSRGAQPAPPSRYYTVTARGRARTGAPEREVRAVVLRDDGGDSVVFQLLYWQDNQIPTEG
jgi:general secretion pathway protein K